MRRRLGQHFLTDERVLDRIVDYAGLNRRDTVLEIGAGTGNLTERLAARAGRVIAIELDYGLVQALSARFCQTNVDIVHGDAMALTLPDFNKTVSNIPYQISSGITFRLLGMGFELGVITYQYEFARRMVAKPGTPDYGRLSVAAQYFADVEILETIPRNAFTPQPEVKSAVVRLTPRPPQYRVENADFFLDFIRAAFSQRRKKLRNAILNSRMPGITQSSISALDTALLEQRAEALAPSELASLSDEVFRLSRREALRP